MIFTRLPYLAVLVALASCSPTGLISTSQASEPREPEFIGSAGFLSAHPDIRWRLEGLRAQDRGDLVQAMRAFRRSARYADKPSAAAIAEMCWNGQGVLPDRARAYAWMDLAAERQWRVFLIRREGMWSQLTPEERARALDIGKEIYAEFGDAVAKPRMTRVLERERRRTTGSRTGFVGALSIEIPTPSGSISVDGSQYYADKYWEPQTYWRWHQETWAPELQGQVDVGTVQTTAGDAPPDDSKPDTTGER